MTAETTLQTCTMAGGSAGPHLLITAGVHGDEFEGMEAARRLISTLRTLEFRGQVTLVPVVNEAAFLRGRRCADDDLDLARRCPGDPEGSVTDRVAAALSRLIRSSDYYVDLHSGGVAMKVVPLTGYMLHADKGVLSAQRRMATAFNLPLIWGTSATHQGRSLSVARDANIPAIYAEYRGAGLCCSEGVDAYYEGCLNVMRELGMTSRAPPPGRIVRRTEDWRVGSGHLQTSHPAPVTGFFQPVVELGQMIDGGELIGRVVDALGTASHNVQAAHAGMVICLASFSRVLAGTGLAVLLEDELASHGDRGTRMFEKDYS